MSIKIGRRDRLLARMKAGLDRLLARGRREEPLPANRPVPAPAHHRVFEILGEPHRRSEGPAKGA